MASSIFHEAFVGITGIDPELLDRPGTTVFGGEDRAGTRKVAWYQVFPVGDETSANVHSFIWADPAVVDVVAELAAPDYSVSCEEAAEVIAAHGGHALGRSTMRMLADPPDSPRVPDGFRMESIESIDYAADQVRLQELLARCTENEVEEAGLESFGSGTFNEYHISVLCPEDSDEIVAYASATDLEWHPLLRDIGVLVRPDYRGDGLGRIVVADSAARIRAAGFEALYRHRDVNTASEGLASGLGFSPVARVCVWQLP